MNLEHRTVHAAVRAPAEGRTFEAKVMSYGIVDDYDTVFDPKVFGASLERRLPRITRGHDWNSVIGKVVDYVDTDEHLSIIAELDVGDTQLATETYAQLRSGTLDNFSVGFRRGETRDVEGRTHFVTATLDEIAVVLAGAVPGTETLSVRSGRMVQVRSGLTVPVETLIEIARKKAAGELSDEEANIALDLAAGSVPNPAPAAVSGPGASAGTDPGPDPLDADAEAALETLGL